MEVRRITASDTYHLRQEILRSGRPIAECHFTRDHDAQSFHLGAFIDKKLVSISSFYFEPHPELEGENHYRLRGMATHPDFRQKGFSKALLKMAFPIIKQNFCSLIWCNARISALGFYDKLGFESHGTHFDVQDIGPHQVLFKDLNELH